MSQEDVTEQIHRLDNSVAAYVSLIDGSIEQIEISIQGEISRTKQISEARIAAILPSLTSLISSIYLDAEYHLQCALWHASPSLIGILSAIWGAIVIVYEAVKWIIEFLHIKELLTLVDIMQIIWPAFREQMQKIYGYISEYSEKIGWGVDGIGHLIQACQGGLDLVGGMLGKDWSWVHFKAADRTVDICQYISDHFLQLMNEPGTLLDFLFGETLTDNHAEVWKWWDKTSKWIEGAVSTAEKAIKDVNDVLEEFQEVQNGLPAFIRDNIPGEIWDGIDWANDKIDETLLPALTKIDKTLVAVNAALEESRLKAHDLAGLIARPGDLLSRIDNLTLESRKLQEMKIDDIASRKYNEDADKYEVEDADIIAEFELIARALEAPLPEPEFMALEESTRHDIIKPPPGIVETWFVVDY